MARNTLYPPSVKPGIPRLGEKPDGWIETTFGEVLRVVQRPAKIDDDIEYQLVTAKRGRGGIVAREVLPGRKILTKIQYYVEKDDFLISKRQIVHGACGVVPESLNGALVSGEYSVLRVQDGLLLKYLDYFSHTDYFQMACFQASVGVDVEKMIFDLKDWLKFKIYLPVLREQEKIVDILNSWDKAIALTNQLIVAKQKLKKGLIQQLFTGKIRLKAVSTHDPALLTWTEIELVDFAKLETKKFNPQKSNRIYPCIELEHISQETGKIIGRTSTEGQKSTKNHFSVGQVLFGKLRPYLRKYAYPDFDGVCSSEIWVMSGRKGVCDNHFLFYLIQSTQFLRSTNITSGTKMPRANWERVAETTFSIPSVAEQQEIVKLLHQFDLEIELLNQKYAVLKQQKKGLMQRLLTGQVRVKI